MQQLPKRDARTLIEALRIRALALTGEAWERTATRDMMKEAAQMLEDLTSALPASVEGSHVPLKLLRERLDTMFREDVGRMARYFGDHYIDARDFVDDVLPRVLEEATAVDATLQAEQAALDEILSLKRQPAASVEGREQALKKAICGSDGHPWTCNCYSNDLQEAGAAPASAVKDMGEPTEYGDRICPECNQQVPRLHRCAAPLVSPQGEERA